MLKSKCVACVHTLLLGLCLAASGGCDKPTADNPPPGGGGAAPVDAPAASNTISLAYKTAAHKIKQSSQVKFNISGAQAGELSADFSALLDISDAGGSLKVAYSVLEVRALNLTGVLKPKPDKDGATPDPNAKLKALTGATIVSTTGEPDSDRTKALPENADNKPEMAQFTAFFQLPELPAKPLALNVPVTVESEEEVDFMGGMKMPTESETIYTLTAVDNSSGKKLATVKIEGTTSGAIEHPQAGTISLDAEEDRTLVFNLDDQIPVSVNGTASQALVFGSQGSAEFAFQLGATYEPG